MPTLKTGMHSAECPLKDMPSDVFLGKGDVNQQVASAVRYYALAEGVPSEVDEIDRRAQLCAQKIRSNQCSHWVVAKTSGELVFRSGPYIRHHVVSDAADAS